MVASAQCSKSINELYAVSVIITNWCVCQIDSKDTSFLCWPHTMVTYCVICFHLAIVTEVQSDIFPETDFFLDYRSCPKGVHTCTCSQQKLMSPLLSLETM